MIRTQIQLRDDQSARLQRLAEEEGCSVAELIRQSVDELLLGRGVTAGRASRAAALRVIGLGRSGSSDVSARHDEYLEEAYSSVQGLDTSGGPGGRPTAAPDAAAEREPGSA